MAFKRNEILGQIVQAIIALRDIEYINPDQITEVIQDHSLSWKNLQENCNFVQGVWSGFTWPVGQEGAFWRLMKTVKQVEAVSHAEAQPQTETQSEQSIAFSA